jgi:hypothetical protein
VGRNLGPCWTRRRGRLLSRKFGKMGLSVPERRVGCCRDTTMPLLRGDSPLNVGQLLHILRATGEISGVIPSAVSTFQVLY